MHRILLPWILDVSQAINNLEHRAVAGASLRDIWYAMFNAKNQLDALFNQSVYSPHLKVSRTEANTLSSVLEKFIASSDGDATLSEFDSWEIRQKREKFLSVFKAELSLLPAFLVSEKEGYELAVLTEAGVKLFPQSMAAKAPEALADAIEAGKALAYELPTASGFHIFRVTEAVLKRYWDHVSGGTARPSPETIGVFANHLETGKLGDRKIWESLKQIAKLHRNPIIHPEAVLTVEEAIETLGIARSIIGAMLRALPDVRPTTSIPPPAP